MTTKHKHDKEEPEKPPETPEPEAPPDHIEIHAAGCVKPVARIVHTARGAELLVKDENAAGWFLRALIPYALLAADDKEKKAGGMKA